MVWPPLFSGGARRYCRPSMTEAYGVPEQRPNDPLLFANLLANVVTLCDHYGKSFYLTFCHDFQPFSQDSEYFLNTYPIFPSQLLGTKGALSQEEYDDYEGDADGLTITEAGVLACATSLGIDGVERECLMWLFNDDFCLEYERIGELAVGTIVAGRDPEDYTVYWVEFDGTVWQRPHDCMERTQLSDDQLRSLIHVLQWVIPW